MAAPTSMSTPVAQLPPGNAASPVNARHDEDQIVADVLKEMSDAKPPSPPPHATSHGSSSQAPHIVQQYALPPMPPSFYTPPSQQEESTTLFGFVEKEHLIRAAVAGIVAIVLFYPDSLEEVYGKVPGIGSKLQPYDKVIRALLLVVLLYVVLWKLNL